MTDKPSPTDTPPPCDQELFDQGVSVGLFDIPKWTAEALCRGIAAATEARVDWHYIGGRVHIKALPAARAPAESVQEDAARYRLLRRGRHWSVIDVIGNDLLRAEALDAAVDAVRKQGAQAMTDKLTPTDAELKAMWQIHAADIGGIFHYARAVLAKWGTPAPVGVGEVAERYRNAIASACEGWTMPDGLRKHLETALWSPPTHEQPVAREPLTNAQREKIIEAVDWYNFPQDVIDAVERAHGIKGGQHGEATPRPTQAQAGAMPLDEARRLFDAGWKAAALFCDREDVVADGIIGFGACPQFEAAFSAANGIKGGQHGTE